MNSSNLHHGQRSGSSCNIRNPLTYSLFPFDRIVHNGTSTSKFGNAINFRLKDQPHTTYLNQ